MPEIEIDTSQLTCPQFTIPEAGTGVIDGSTSPRPTISLPARAGYHIQQGSSLIGDFEFDVKEDGAVDFDAAFDGFLSGRGERRLTVRGHAINIDGRALSTDLFPLGIAGPGATFLPHATVNQLTMISASGYSFQAGDGIFAGPQLRGRAGRRGPARSRLRRVRQRQRQHADHPGPRDQHRRPGAVHRPLPPRNRRAGANFLPHATVNQLTMIPASGYSFQAGDGIFADLSYGVGRDGAVQLDPGFAAFASASGNTLTIRGHAINIDGRALSTDLFPLGIAGPGATFPTPCDRQPTHHDSGQRLQLPGRRRHLRGPQLRGRAGRRGPARSRLRRVRQRQRQHADHPGPRDQHRRPGAVHRPFPLGIAGPGAPPSYPMRPSTNSP